MKDSHKRLFNNWQDLAPANQLAGDRELFAILENLNFSGPLYRKFEGVLAEYGFAVMQAWLRGNKFSYHLRQKRVRGLPADLPDFAKLRHHQLEELVLEIVSTAVVNFREKCLVAGKWDPAGTASLKTFFINQCLFSSVTPIRKLISDLERETVAVYLDALPITGDAEYNQQSQPALEDAVISVLNAQELYGVLTPTESKILELKSEKQLSAREIGRSMGMTPKAVNNHLTRIRGKLRPLRLEKDTG